MLMSGCLSACAMSVPVFSYGSMIPYIYSYLWMNVSGFKPISLHKQFPYSFVDFSGFFFLKFSVF